MLIEQIKLGKARSGGALPVTFCITRFGVLSKFVSLAPGFTRGHNRIAPTELLLANKSPED